VERTKYAIWHERPTGYEDAYWIATMKNAYKAKWNKTCYYKINNPKAQRALRCSFCNKHPIAAKYDTLELYSQEHMPSIVQ